MKQFSKKTRQENINNFKSEAYDICIIGGGITGAGIARDAASRGMKVALVEMSDFASGTSSRSSKLIHGGIRYLENLEFGLVYEALSERRKLFSMAPHLVHPLRFLLPMYKDDRVGMFKMGLGMWLYDILSLFEAPEMHERLSSTDSVQRIPSLNENELVGSYVYSDAYMDDDRLVLETLRSANDFGAHCANYIKATSANFTDKKVTSIECEDQIDGSKFTIQAKHFLSTVGPWTDRVATDLLKDWKSIMRPSKGIHLTFHKDRLPLSCAAVMATGKRIVFAIPRHEMVIVGTTDTDFKDDPANVHSSVEDVEYLLKVVDEYFPGAKLKKSDIIASYAGVRPLVHDGSSSESSTSRDHAIINDPRNITFVAGGKYTTYRHMSEQAVESVLSYFSIEEQVEFSRTNTTQALNPQVTEEKFALAQRSVEQWSQQSTLKYNEVKELVDRYGGEAESMLNPLSGNRWLAEAEHAVNNTMCINLRDFYLRRTPMFLAYKDHGQAHLDVVAQFFAEKYDWTNDQVKQQKDLLQAHIDQELGWQ